MMDEFAARGLRVPDDLSVIAVASSTVADRTSPPVTAADVPASSLAAVAVETLLKRIGSTGSPPVRQLFRSQYIDRGSVARPVHRS